MYVYCKGKQMSKNLNPQDVGKKAAALKALDFICSGMIVGLGSGSTAWFFLEVLAKKIKEENLEVIGIPTSQSTLDRAKKLGIPISNLDSYQDIDLVIDGTDEFDTNLALIKGGGGALLQEKIVAMAAKQMIVIADESKKVDKLGSFPLPVEVNKFGFKCTRQYLKNMLEEFGLRNIHLNWRLKGNQNFITDEGHYILDLSLGFISKPEYMQNLILSCPGVVETGLFLNTADKVILGGADGKTVVMTAEES